MSATNLSVTSSTPAASAAPASVAAPASGPAAEGAPASASITSTPAAAPQTLAARSKSTVQRAADRATARRTAGDGAGNPNTPAATTAGPSGNLPAGDAGTGAAAVDGNDGTATAGAEDATSTTGSTVTAPDDWPEDYKQRFTALPTDEARSMLLDSYKDMQRHFTESSQTLTRLRKDHEALVRTVESHGLEVGDANRILGIAKNFDTNPRQVLEQLAKDAGVEVFFERPLPEGEIPEFKSTAEMAAWFDKRAVEREQSARTTAEQKAADDRQREEHRTRLRTELDAARKTHGENFTKAQTAVMERLLKPMSIEDAYLVLQIPALQKQAKEAAATKQELATVKAELESLRKRATQPPAGARLNGQAAQADESRLSPPERAMRRAASRKAAANHA
jgi:hypothetical protein